MSEGITIALIIAIGSLLGGVLEQIISASATVKAAQIKEKVNQPHHGKDKKPNSWGRTIAGAIIGAIVTLIVLFMLGMIPPKTENPPVATATKKSPISTAPGSTSKVIARVTIPSNLASGINYEAPNTGTYTFKYIDSAFTAFSGCWSTHILGYFGPVPRWDSNSDLDIDNALFSLGSAVCAASADAAIKRTQGEIASFKLNIGDIITLVVGDGRSDYLDNVGNIILDIYFVEN